MPARIPQSASHDVQISIQDLNDDIVRLRRTLAGMKPEDYSREIQELQAAVKQLAVKPNYLEPNEVFRASGAAHALGYVPDPGVTAGTVKYLREDATWVDLATPGTGLFVLKAGDTMSGPLIVTGSGYAVNPAGIKIGQYTSTVGYVQAPSGGSVQIWNDASYAIAAFSDDQSTTFYSTVTLTQASEYTPNFIINNTSAGNVGGYFKMQKFSASPADGDYLGLMVWQGYNDAATPEILNYGAIYTLSNDVSDGTEDGGLYFDVCANGTLTTQMNITDGQVYVVGTMTAQTVVDRP